MVMRSMPEVLLVLFQNGPPGALREECGRLTHVFNKLPLIFGKVRPEAIIHRIRGLILHVHGVASSGEIEAARLLARGIGAEAEGTIRTRGLCHTVLRVLLLI
jgi:hypothetical protein